MSSWVEPYRAFLRAEQAMSTEHAQDVLFCMTSDPHRIYCAAFKGDRSFRDALNPVNLRFGPEYSSIWETDDDD